MKNKYGIHARRNCEWKIRPVFISIIRKSKKHEWGFPIVKKDSTDMVAIISHIDGKSKDYCLIGGDETNKGLKADLLFSWITQCDFGSRDRPGVWEALRS